MNVDAFLPHMRDVARCEESLRELNLMWRVIEATAKMNCPDEAHSLLPMMAATRAGFQRLEKELVASPALAPHSRLDFFCAARYRAECKSSHRSRTRY